MSDLDSATTATILDTAERLFAERGYRGTTVQLLARESGLSPGLPFYYFGSKAGLYQAVLERLFGQLASRGRQQLSDHPDPAAAVRALLGTQAELLLTRPTAARLVARELAEFQAEHALPAMRQGMRQLFTELAGAIARGQATGQFRSEFEPRFAAMSCISQVAWFALASPVAGMLLDEDAGQPSAATRRAFALHAADFAVSALTADREVA